MTEIQNSKQKKPSFKCSSTRREPLGRTIGICGLEIICNLALVICDFPDNSGFPLSAVVAPGNYGEVGLLQPACPG